MFLVHALEKWCLQIMKKKHMNEERDFFSSTPFVLLLILLSLGCLYWAWRNAGGFSEGAWQFVMVGGSWVKGGNFSVA